MTIMRRFGCFTAKSKLGDNGRPANEAKMSILLRLNDALLQNIMRLLDDVTFAKLSLTCKRLNELSHSHLSWSCSLMGKRIEKFIYDAYDSKDQRDAKAIYESCCNAELLNLNLDIIDERTAVSIWKALGTLGGRLLALVTRVDACDTNEIWPFCHVTNKEIRFELPNETKVTLHYVSLCDKHSSFNNHTKVRVTTKNPDSTETNIVFNSKPMGLLDSGIVQTRMTEPDYGETMNFHEIQNHDVLRPVFELFERELGILEHAISFQLFMKFLQSIERNSKCGFINTEVVGLAQNTVGLKELIRQIKRRRRKLQLEFLRTEQERNHILQSDTDFQELSCCLAKLAQTNGKKLKNIRLRAQCIKGMLSNMDCTSIQQDMEVFPSVIKNIDLDSIQSGWACINPNLFTTWKEFTIRLGKGKHFKATITWQEKRDRVNEYSVSNKEICLILERKGFSTKIKMSNAPTETAERRASLRHIKTSLKQFISKVRLRKTGLNEVNQQYLFIILMAILNE